MGIQPEFMDTLGNHHKDLRNSIELFVKSHRIINRPAEIESNQSSRREIARTLGIPKSSVAEVVKRLGSIET